MSPFAKNEKKEKENVNEKRISNTHRHSIHTHLCFFLGTSGYCCCWFLLQLLRHTCVKKQTADTIKINKKSKKRFSKQTIFCTNKLIWTFYLCLCVPRIQSTTIACKRWHLIPSKLQNSRIRFAAISYMFISMTFIHW